MRPLAHFPPPSPPPIFPCLPYPTRLIQPSSGGWTDPELGNEIAMVSLFDGTAFVDITDPVNPIVLGKLDTHPGTLGSDWGDIKVYQDVAYIGSEAVDHGMQIHDLLTLRELYGKKAPAGTVRNIPEQLHYDGFGRSHNIVLNTDSGFLYGVGSRQGTNICDGGPHIVDIRGVRGEDGSLNMPSYVGCFGDDGYTHDAEVVIYTGPDEEFQGREIMVCAMCPCAMQPLPCRAMPCHDTQADSSGRCVVRVQHPRQHPDHHRHDRSLQPRDHRLADL
eukprot:COSAG01_NODE_13187_length_1623_cov_1.489501_3_plen_276_part_00